MKCSFVEIDGRRVVFCGSKSVRQIVNCHATTDCKALSGYQCDWLMPGTTFRCDRYICIDHAHQVAKNKHLCPEHWEAWQTHPANKQKDLFS